MFRTAVVVGVIAVILAFCFLPPVPEGFEAHSFCPSALPVFEVNNLLRDRGRKIVGDFVGPESIAFDSDGHLYTGSADGRILRSSSPDNYASGTFSVFARTGAQRSDCGKREVLADCGRPLGLRFDATGNLLVADAYKGLLSIDRNGTVSVLTNAYNGQSFSLLNDVAVASTGEIYLAEASFKHGYHNLLRNVLEYGAYGRVYKYDPSTKQTTLVLDDLFFAAGIELSPDEDVLLVAELLAFRIRRIYLKGPRAGESEIWIDNIAGTPDNIRYDATNRLYWVAAASARGKPEDAVFLCELDVITLLASRPWVRTLLARVLPQSYLVSSSLAPTVILAYNETGDLVHTLQDQSGELFGSTAATCRNGSIYVGNYLTDFIIQYPFLD